MKSHLSINVSPKGFTLIEMVAVIALISILAMMAIPSFADRIIRKQIEEVMPLAELAKKSIAVSWQATQTFPADNAAAGLPPPDKIVNQFVSAVTVKDGAINLTFGNRAHSALVGKILSLRPAVVTDAPIVPITWICANAETPKNMTVFGTDQTTIPRTYLPLDCRKLK